MLQTNASSIGENGRKKYTKGLLTLQEKSGPGGVAESLKTIPVTGLIIYLLIVGDAC